MASDKEGVKKGERELGRLSGCGRGQFLHLKLTLCNLIKLYLIAFVVE